MPAWGTVTMSPGWRRILLRVSPFSISSFRFTVMTLPDAGGTPAESLASVAGDGACASWDADGKVGVLETDFASSASEADASLAEGSADAEAPGAEVATGCG